MLRFKVLIPSRMLGSNNPSFVGERMDLMSKGEKNDEVSLQSLMVISVLFILPLSSSTFSTEVVFNELSLGSLTPNPCPHPHQNQSTDVPCAVIFVPSA